MSQPTLMMNGFHPTIASTYDAVEKYLHGLGAAADGLAPLPYVALQPVDALLVHLLATSQSPPVEVVDLAADATRGASTVLALSTPGVWRVTAGTTGAEGRAWRPALTRYLATAEPAPSAQFCEINGNLTGAEDFLSRQAPLVVLLAADGRAETAAQIECWLEHNPLATLVIIGIGATGTCSTIASLVACCAGSARQLVLARELAPALAASQLAIIGRRDNASVEPALDRVRELFVHNFRFVDLVQDACRAALKQVRDKGADPTRPNYKPPEDASTEELHEAIETLQQSLAKREREVEALRQSLDAMTGSLRVWASIRARQAVRFVAPAGSPQRWLLEKMRRAIRPPRTGSNRRKKPSRAR